MNIARDPMLSRGEDKKRCVRICENEIGIERHFRKGHKHRKPQERFAAIYSCLLFLSRPSKKCVRIPEIIIPPNVEQNEIITAIGIFFLW